VVLHYRGGSTCAFSGCLVGGGPGDVPSDVSYGFLDGTSMATPFVSAAALVKEECPTFGPDQVRAELVNHAGSAVPSFSFGRVDAGAAVAARCA
jgi:hypothetical protein